MVLVALVSRRAFVGAKRWGVRCGTSGSSQRDRLRVEGSLARWLRRGRPNCQGVFDGAKRERVRRGWMLVAGCAFVVAVAECWLNCHGASRRSPEPPLRSTGGGGDCGGRARGRGRRGCALASGRAVIW